MKRLLVALFAAIMLIAPTHAYAEPDAEPTSDEQAIAVDIDAVGEDAGTEAPLGEDAASASIAPADVPEPIPSSDASSTDGSNPASTDGSNATDFDESADPEQSVIPAEPSDADELGGEDSEASSGWVTIDGFTYFVDPQTGERLSDGIFEIDGESYYLRPAGSPYGPEGSLGSGWVRNYGGNTYFFDRETGRMYSDGIYDIDGSRYYFRPKESPYGPVGSMGRGWVLSYGEQELDYFFDRSSAAMVFGRADIDGSSYYFDSESGAKQTGWAEFDGNRYCYAPDGKMLSDGIYEVDGSSYFFRPAGSAYGPKGSLGYGWVRDFGGNAFFFDRTDGHMLSDGIYEVDGSSYFFRPADSEWGPEGSMGRGWVRGDDNQPVDRFFDRVNGRMYVNGVFAISGAGSGVYGFDADGAVLNGWQTLDDSTYYFDASKGGSAAIGIVSIDGTSYFFRSSGSSYGPEGSRGSGWVINYHGNTFFFDRTDGHMLSDGIFEVDGASYYFRPAGSEWGPEGSMGRGWVRGYGEEGVDRFFDRTTGRMAVSGAFIIDRSVYLADMEGNLTLSSFGQHLDAASAKQLKVVSAAWKEPTTPSGWCALWVHNVFEAYGIMDVNGNACDLYNEYCTSSNPADLQVGMIVAVSRHPGTAGGRIYGHIGIYVGNGVMLDSSGEVRIWNVEDWINSYNGWVTPKWGWYGNRKLG